MSNYLIPYAIRAGVKESTKKHIPFPDPQEFLKKMLSGQRAKILGGAVAGGALMAALPAGEKLTPEQEARRVELKKEYKDTPFYNIFKKEELKLELAVLQSPLRNRIELGLIGAGAGFFLARRLTQGNLKNNIDTYNGLMKKHVILGEEASNVRFHPRYEADLLAKAKGAIYKDMRAVSSDGKILPQDVFKSLHKKINAEALNADMQERMADLGLPGSAIRLKRVPLTQEEQLLRNRFHTEFKNNLANQMLGTSTSKVTALVGDLKRKGVTSAQDFIKKYHPDTNPTTPKEYLHNFKEIIDNFRGKNSVGVTTMDLGQLAREEYMKSQEAARVINKMMEKKAAVAEFTPDGREKEVQQYPQKGKKFHEELPADGWAGPILDGRLID